MKNFDNTIIEQTKENCNVLYEIYDKSDAWVDKHLKYEEQKALLAKIKKSRSEIRKVGQGIDSKPVFALFGVSQVGKSYLVKNLLSIKGGPLEIVCGQNKIDFLKSINPQGGGAESTGVVTRFSIETCGISDEYAVKAKLLSIKDIIILLSDSFYSDITRLDAYPSKEEFQQLSTEIKDQYGDAQIEQKFINEDDIWDIREYFHENFNKFSHFVNEIEKSGFWSSVGSYIEKVSIQDLHKIFELLWCRNSHITAIFNRVIEELGVMHFEKEVFVSEDAILREKGAILDVQKLNGIFSSSEMTQVALSNGAILNVKTSLLSALTAELTLSVDPTIAQSKQFLNNTDLLDFPGARGRLEFSIENVNEKSVVDMFLRGKIAYLFNKYSSGFEINNLLFCMKDEQIEVNELSAVLNNWIVKNIGENADAREKRIGNLPSSPLFVVLTFFNKQLKYDSINDENDLNYKWDNRFVRFFEKQITAKYNWDKDWTQSNPNFSNFFLLRDFKFSEDTFDGFEETGSEIKIKEERVVHWDRLKQSFLQFPFVKTHFKNAEESWNLSALPGRDGSDMIIRELEPAATNYVKVKNFNEKLRSFKDKLENNLSRHYISDNLKDKRDNAFQLGVNIQFGLMRLFNAPNFQLADFLKIMSLKDVEVYNYIHDNFLKSTKSGTVDQYAIFRATFPGISEEKSKDDNLNIIAEYLNMSSIEEAEKYLLEQGIDLDQALENKVITSATLLVDGVIDHWKQKLNFNEFEEFIKKGLDRKTLDALIENLIVTFDMLNVREELVKLFEEKTKLAYSPMDTEEYLASICTGIINDFVTSFGFNYMGKDRISELKELCAAYKMDLSILESEENNMSNDVLLSIYNEEKLNGVVYKNAPLIEQFNMYLLKIKLALLSNCGFVNYDIHANEELNMLMLRLKDLEFTVE